jgi:Ni,Fe-hydrogenase III large subunit
VTATYRERIGVALADGWRFAGLHASANGSRIHVLLVRREETRIETTDVADHSAPSIVDLAFAAGWDEREAHDLHGVGFDGHAPLRPLVTHDPHLDSWTVPVRGHDTYQVAVGPVHAGVIESGHFRFHVVGERILHLDARLFYKHRGLERAAEGKTIDEGLKYASRACAACTVANGIAYVRAAEVVRGLEPTPELARVRTVLLELERMWSHLNDIAAVCAGVGLAAGNSRFAALVERARRLNLRLTGHRFLFGSVRVGGSVLQVHADDVAAARREVASIRTAAVRGIRELLFNASFQDRLPEVGIVTQTDALRLGTVGPAARASGVRFDVREHDTHLAYAGFVPVTPTRHAGDVQARVEQRTLELEQTFRLLEDLLDGRIAPSTTTRSGLTQSVGVGRVESPRGETSCILERAGDLVERLRLRTGSYANWPSVAHAAANNLLPDFPLINKSFELCYACADR